MKSHVGVERPPSKETSGPWNAPDDVCWLKRRLKVHEHFQGDVTTPDVTDDLLKAIKAAQTNDPSDPPYVKMTGDTQRRLRDSPRREQAGGGAGSGGAGSGGAAARQIDPGLLTKLRELEEGRPKVVSGLRVKVSAGELLWTMGVGVGEKSGLGTTDLNVEALEELLAMAYPRRFA